MRSIAHISDLHFGRTDPQVLEGLQHAVLNAKPDVLVVSGDLTQRAKSQEFAEARDFLSELPAPQIVVPGNHDVPLYNAFKRWLTPLANFRHYITADPAPFHKDDEVAVLGLNTARALTFINGRVNRRQAASACAAFGPLKEDVVRIVVTHHPFALPQSASRNAVVGRARMAMRAFAACKVDIVLSGHLHVSQTVSSTALYGNGHAALLVQAGTASSTRRRDEANAFNLLRIGGGRISIERHGWENGRFGVSGQETFVREAEGWMPAAA